MTFRSALQLFLLFCCFARNECAAQFPAPDLKLYTTSDGLCDNSIHCLTRDSRGFLWIGTNEGLSRFDGAGFRNFYAGNDSLHNLPGNSVSHLQEIRDGHMAIISGFRLRCLNASTNSFYSPPPPLNKKAITSIRGMPGKKLVLHSTDNVFIADSSLRILRQIPVPPFQDRLLISSAIPLWDDSLLISNGRQHFLCDIVTGKMTEWLPGVHLPESENLLYFLASDATKRELYFANYWHGLYVFDLKGNLAHHYVTQPQNKGLSSNHIGTVMFAPGSGWLVGTESGLDLLSHSGNDTRFQQIFAGFPASARPFVSCVIYDGNGKGWIGSNKGLYRLMPRLAKTVIDGSLLSPAVNAEWSVLAPGPGNWMLAGNYNDGSWLVNRQTGQASLLDQDRIRMVWSFNHDREGLIIAGAGPAVFHYRPVGKKWAPFSALRPFFGNADIATLYFRDSRGDEWFSFNQGSGLVRKPAGQETYEHYYRNGPRPAFSLSYLANATEDSRGDCWFAVNKRMTLLQWNYREKKFREFDLDTLPGLKGNILGGIQALYAGKDSLLWVTSESAGLVAFNVYTHTATLYTIADGLPSTYINSITGDGKGRLWMGTRKGLVCFIPQEKRTITFKKANGLPSEEFTSTAICYDKQTGLLWVAAGNLIFSVDPDELAKPASRPASLVVDEVLVNGSALPTDAYARLDFSENNLRFAYTGIDLENGSELEYAYYLEGAEKDWVAAGDRKTAFYHQLSPGTYRFHLRTRHKGDDNWLEMRAAFVFSISKAWWQTLAFRIGALLLIAVLAWLLVRIYLFNKLRRQRATLEKELAIEQERIRLARELHDGLGSKLSGVKHSFTALKNELQLDPDKAGSFDYTIDKLNESISELRNVSHSMLSAGLLEEGLESALQNYCGALGHGGKPSIHFNAITDKPLNLHPETAFHIFRVVQELLQNIIRHAAAQQVLVQLSTNEGWLHITVEDDGKGFDWHPGMRYAGIGLRNIENRLKWLKGKLDIQSAPGKGTSVHLEIPLSDQVHPDRG